MSTIPQNPSKSPFMHLHYGGSAPVTRGISSRPLKNKTFQMQRRLELLIRLEQALVPPAAIAAMFCISVRRLHVLKNSPDYLIARMKITQGLIVDSSGELAQIKEQRKEFMVQHLPAALAVLANELLAPAYTLAERKHKTEIARDWMDREGTFAKVSRTEIKPVDTFDFEGADAASRNIIAAVRGIAAPASQHSIDAVEANAEFSNSHTLSAVDQQAALETLEKALITSTEFLEALPTDGKVN